MINRFSIVNILNHFGNIYLRLIQWRSLTKENVLKALQLTSSINYISRTKTLSLIKSLKRKKYKEDSSSSQENSRRRVFNDIFISLLLLIVFVYVLGFVIRIIRKHIFSCNSSSDSNMNIGAINKPRRIINLL